MRRLRIPPPRPNRITCDFEIGLIPALQQEFNVRITGCYFHYTQCIFRKVQQLGLAMDYREHERIRMPVRMLMAIAFVPLQLVQQTYDDLKDQMPLNVRAKLAGLLQYFEEQWMQRVDPALWNVYGAEKRTNNDLEGWHNRFNKLCEKLHPNIYQFVEALIKEQQITKTTLAQIAAGARVVRKNRVYEDINKRIFALKERYDNGDIDVHQYLRGISYNLAGPMFNVN